MEELYNHLAALPQEYLEYFILRLMQEEKISFSRIAVQHTEYIKSLKKGETQQLMELRSKFIDLWCSTKKELPSKIVSLMQEAKDKGWANITQEQINNSKWNNKH